MFVCSFPVETASWSENDRQSGEHVPGGSSRRVHGQLQPVAGLRLVQLPRRRQDVPAQHSRHPTRRQLSRHPGRQRMGLVETHLLHCPLGLSA